VFRKIILVTTGEHRYIMILKETDDSVQKGKKKKCGSLHYKGWKEISSSDITVK